MKKTPPNFKIVLLALMLGGYVESTIGAVNAVGYWRMGEDDPAAADGGEVSNQRGAGIVDLAGPSNFYSYNTTPPVYSADVPPKSADPTESIMSVYFGTAKEYLRLREPTKFNFDDNFGVELWVKAAGTEKRGILVYNGMSDTSTGWGILFDPDSMAYTAILGGVAYIGKAPASSTEWTHLALVRDTSSFGTALYANGELLAANEKAVIRSTKGASGEWFSIAATPGAGGPFQGFIDEVRVFTFQPGQFDVSDLLYKKP